MSAWRAFYSDFCNILSRPFHYTTQDLLVLHRLCPFQSSCRAGISGSYTGEAVGFGHLYHSINYNTRICTFLAVIEQPVLTAQCHRAEGILQWIVTQAAASVFEVSHQSVFSVSDIYHCQVLAAPFSGFWPSSQRMKCSVYSLLFHRILQSPWMYTGSPGHYVELRYF